MADEEWWSRVKHWEIWSDGLRDSLWEWIPPEAQKKLREIHKTRFPDKKVEQLLNDP